MAPQLWMLRHGEAVPHDSKPDDERELTPRGRAPVRGRGRGARRARRGVRGLLREPEGARVGDGRLACEASNIEPVERGLARRRLQPRRRARAARRPRRTTKILVVGHEPSFSQVVYDFTGGRVDFKKGGVAAVHAARARRRAARAAAPARARGDRRAPLASALVAARRGSRASATSARGCSDASSTNSSGLCALPPRGPRPSTVTGIAAAKWLASLAPPRAAGDDRAAERGARAREQRRASRSSACIPGQRRISSASSRTPSSSAGIALEHGLDRVQVVGAHVAEQLAVAGDDVERVAGAQHGRDGGQVRRARRVVAARRRPGRRRRARAARCGRGRAPSPSARCGRAPVTWIVPAALRRTTTPSSLAAPARRPRSTGTRRSRRSASTWANGGGPPLLVADQQQRELVVELRAARRSARSAPSASTSPPFMSTEPEPTSCSPDARAAACARRARRRCRRGRAAARLRVPVPCSAGDQVLRRGRGRSTGCARSSPRRAAARRTPRAHSSAPCTSPEGDETADQRLELARRPARDLRRRLLDPRVHARPG